jgi:hypothetical protein
MDLEAQEMLLQSQSLSCMSALLTDIFVSRQIKPCAVKNTDIVVVHLKTLM